MDGCRSRELIIEIERIQLIRKRAKTRLYFCDGCRGDSDHVALKQAARLFETPDEHLFSFIHKNDCHFKADAIGEIHICLTALLSSMKAVTNGRARKSLGGKDEQT